MAGIFKVGGAKIWRLGENTVEAARQAGLAALSATLAGHYANDSGNTDVPGGVTGERGAKYWSSLTSSALTAIQAAIASSGSGYAIKSDYSAAVSGLTANTISHVFADESRGGRWAIYKKVSGVGTFQSYAMPAPFAWFVDSNAGIDTNPGTQASPFLTLDKAVSVCAAGDTIFLLSGANIKWQDNVAYGSIPVIPDGVNIIGLGSGAVINAFDKVTGAWTANSGAYYKDVVNKFGGAAALQGLLYPFMIYRVSGVSQWQQIKWYSNNDAGLTTDALGIAFVQANPGTGWVQDLTYSGSRTGGYRKGGTLRYHVNLGTDPSAYSWLVCQRHMLNCGFNHRIENVAFFGGIQHDGLVVRGSRMVNVDVAYPAFHAMEITGTSTDRLTLRGARLKDCGYAFHHFGASANYAKQPRALHRNTRLYDWTGALMGLHGVDNTDGGGGAGIVTSTVRFEDGIFQNVNDISYAGSLNLGVEFNDCKFINYTAMGSWGTNVVYNRCILVAVDPYLQTGFAGGSRFAFSTPASPMTVTLNDCQIVMSSASGRIGGSGSDGKLVFNRCKIAVRGNTSLFLGVGNGSGVVMDSTVVQAVDNASHKAGSALVNNPLAGLPIVITNSFIGGFANPSSLAGVTIDAHTPTGGDSGLSITGDAYSPLQLAKAAPARLLGEKLLPSVPASVPGTFDRGAFFATTKAAYGVGLGFTNANVGYAGSVNLAYPTGFVPNGAFAPSASVTNTKGYIYGNGGLLYKNSGYSATSYTAVTTGTTVDFTGHLVDGNTVFLLGRGGSIHKIDTATDTVTQIHAAGAVASYPLLGGLVSTSGGNLLIFGGYDYGDANFGVLGGCLYSTNGGTSWASVPSNPTRASQIRGMAKVNGVHVAVSTAGDILTGTAVGTAMTVTSIKGLASYSLQGVVAEPTLNQLAIICRGNPFDGIAPTRYALAFIDCSSATVSTWKPRLVATPFCPAAVFYNGAENYALATSSVAIVSATGRIAALADTFDSNVWSLIGGDGFGERLPTLTAPLDVSLSDANGYLNA